MSGRSSWPPMSITSTPSSIRIRMPTISTASTICVRSGSSTRRRIDVYADARRWRASTKPSPTAFARRPAGFYPPILTARSDNARRAVRDRRRRRGRSTSSRSGRSTATSTRSASASVAWHTPATSAICRPTACRCSPVSTSGSSTRSATSRTRVTSASTTLGRGSHALRPTAGGAHPHALRPRLRDAEGRIASGRRAGL